MKSISLTRGLEAIIDDEDYVEISQYKWHAQYSAHSDSFYAARTCPGILILMHRQILNLSGKQQTDHVNRNILDNRKSNLRICNFAENQANRAKVRRPCTSIFKGVSWYKRQQKWRACIGINLKTHHLGFFESEKEAAKAYDLAAFAQWGDYALLNFPLLGVQPSL